MLLANLQSKSSKEAAVEKLGKKYGVEKTQYQQPFQLTPEAAQQS